MAPSTCLLSINPHSWISTRPKVSRLNWTMIVPSWIFLPFITENSRILELLRTNKQNNNRNKNKKADGYTEAHVTLKDMAVEDQKHLHMFSGWYIIRKAGTVWLPQRPYFTTFYLGLCEGGFHLQPTNVNDLNAAVMDRVFFFMISSLQKGGIPMRTWKWIKRPGKSGSQESGKRVWVNWWIPATLFEVTLERLPTALKP